MKPASGQSPASFSVLRLQVNLVRVSLARIEPVGTGFRVQSDLRNHRAIVQPRGRTFARRGCMIARWLRKSYMITLSPALGGPSTASGGLVTVTVFTRPFKLTWG
jgi:hypothetical protein